MIRLTKQLPDGVFCDVAAAKIYCNFAAYANYENIALFWVQQQDTKSTAVMCLIDGNFTLSTNGADIDELRDFIKVISPDTVFTDCVTAQKLGLNIKTECAVCVSEYPHTSGAAIENTNLGITALYGIMKDFFPIDKQSFTADISHRIRHNSCIYVTGNYSAAVMLLSARFAVVTGICVDAKKQLKGLGSATLHRLLNSARDRTVYACCDEDTLDFYLKNGFKRLENSAYCTL